MSNDHDLIDICIDTGRVPFAYTGKKQRVELSKNGVTVSKETIDEILANLGGESQIGSDNRAGLDRHLHRISVMRSKIGEVYGLPMRVGRAMRNAACLLTDLLLSKPLSDKSVLMLGRPGSGKTTLIRDVAGASRTQWTMCALLTCRTRSVVTVWCHTCVLDGHDA